MKASTNLAASGIFLTAIIAVGILFGIGASVYAQPSKQSPATNILWSTTRSCSGNFTVLALRYGQPYEKNSCRQVWLVMVPRSEGGNLTQELSYYEQNKALFSGVILDDFVSADASLPSVYHSLSNQTTVCPVLYAPMQPQPSYTNGCLILALSPSVLQSQVPANPSVKSIGQYTTPNFEYAAPVSTYVAAIKWATSEYHAQAILLLAYGQTNHVWKYSIPANYKAAVAECAVQGMVMWE